MYYAQTKQQSLNVIKKLFIEPFFHWYDMHVCSASGFILVHNVVWKQIILLVLHMCLQMFDAYYM